MPEKSFLGSTSLKWKWLTILDGDLKMIFNLEVLVVFSNGILVNRDPVPILVIQCPQSKEDPSSANENESFIVQSLEENINIFFDIFVENKATVNNLTKESFRTLLELATLDFFHFCVKYYKQ